MRIFLLTILYSHDSILILRELASLSFIIQVQTSVIDYYWNRERTDVLLFMSGFVVIVVGIMIANYAILKKYRDQTKSPVTFART